MPNHRIHPYLHVDRKSRIHFYSGRKNYVRAGEAIPEDGYEYVVLPQDVRPADNTTIPLQVRIGDAGKPHLVREAAVYSKDFLQRFFNEAYTAEDRLALLQVHYGRYTRNYTPESFVDFLEQDLIPNAQALLGIKEDAATLWQRDGGQLLRQWIQVQRGHLEKPVGTRNGNRQAQSLDLKSQLAVVHYLHKGGHWPGSLLPSNELVGFLAGVLARPAKNIEPLLPHLTERPSQERNLVLNEKYITRAKKHFVAARMPHLVQLAESDLMALK